MNINHIALWTDSIELLKDFYCRWFGAIALSLGSGDRVDEMTERMRDAGIKILGEPRTTGDGCYESVIADPEGNIVELTV